jgi:hypothetical protein
MTDRVLGPDDRLWWERDRIDVTSDLPRPDPTWRYTDSFGHEHRREANSYPTLTWVIDRTYWCEGCRDEHTEGHYECRECRQWVTPGLVPAPLYREYVPGMTHYYLNDEEISREEYERLLALIEGGRP